VFLARDREIVETAYAGDIIGLPNHGTIKIGDTFTSGEPLRFTGIPSFAPELFRRVLLKSPLKAKSLAKGLTQLAEEGAIQVFKPFLGTQYIVGAVGQLQLEVMKHRLKSEYDVDADYEGIEYSTARWVTPKTEGKSKIDIQKLMENFQHKNQGTSPSTATATSPTWRRTAGTCSQGRGAVPRHPLLRDPRAHLRSAGLVRLAGAVGLALLACRPPPPPPPSYVWPPNPAAVATAISQHVFYTLGPVREQGLLTALAVEVRWNAPRTGVSRLALPERWADARELWRHIEGFAVEGATAVKEDGPVVRVITAVPGAELVARYRVRSAYAQDPSSSDGQPFAPIIRPKWFHAFGEALFAVPDENFDAPAQLRLDRRLGPADRHGPRALRPADAPGRSATCSRASSSAAKSCACTRCPPSTCAWRSSATTASPARPSSSSP
jgi:hypothetical protein